MACPHVIARAMARRSALTVGNATTQIYEGLSTRIMRANARSLLARVCVGGFNGDEGMGERVPETREQSRLDEAPQHLVSSSPLAGRAS